MQLFIDLETTGLAPKSGKDYVSYTDTTQYSNCKIIQICMRLYSGNKLIDEMYRYVDPQIPIPQVVSKMTGITQSQVLNKKLTKGPIKKIKILVEKSDIIIGHNIDFDITVLCAELFALGEKDLAKYVFEKKRFCTMKNSSKLQLGGKYLKLETMYNMFYKENLGKSHDAKTDVLMCKKIYDVYKLKE
jgi:DNA polymerase III epsilon subunit-like protein